MGIVKHLELSSDSHVVVVDEDNDDEFELVFEPHISPPLPLSLPISPPSPLELRENFDLCKLTRSVMSASFRL